MKHIKKEDGTSYYEDNSNAHNIPLVAGAIFISVGAMAAFKYYRKADD